jgi:hypothetical protein
MFDKQSTAHIFISAYQRDKHYLTNHFRLEPVFTSLFRRAQKMVDPQPILFTYVVVGRYLLNNAFYD